MVWRRIGDKPLSEPMLARFTDAYTLYVARGEMSVKALPKGVFEEYFLFLLYYPEKDLL